jgi:hypothetical protein
MMIFNFLCIYMDNDFLKLVLIYVVKATVRLQISYIELSVLYTSFVGSFAPLFSLFTLQSFCQNYSFFSFSYYMNLYA